MRTNIVTVGRHSETSPSLTSMAVPKWATRRTRLHPVGTTVPCSRSSPGWVPPRSAADRLQPQALSKHQCGVSQLVSCVTVFIACTFFHAHCQDRVARVQGLKLRFVSYTANLLEQTCGFRKCTMFHLKWISNLQDLPQNRSLENSPSLHCLAVFPT